MTRSGSVLLRGAVAFCLSFTTSAPLLGGQSLAEVAKKEEARRKAVKTPAKVYTNEDLKSDPTKPTTPPPTPVIPEPTSTTNTTPQVPAVNLPGGKAESPPTQKGETYWRDRIATARAALERSRVLVDAVQSRLNALATDIVNRDDPAQRSQLELERQRASLEMARLNKEITEQTKNIAAIEEEARKAGVPPGWLR